MSKKEIPSYLTVSAKIKLNVNDLNNETIAGNVTDIRTIYTINNEGKAEEQVAVSGRMMKHWHLAWMRALEIKETQPKLCSECKQAEPMRPGNEIVDDIMQNKNIAKEEKSQKIVKEAIKNCIIDDVHGFLVAAEKVKGIAPPRRDSRALFSWLLPLGESVYKQVLHTRVSKRIRPEEKAQMIFYKSYASGLYGFVSVLDTANIGYFELMAGSEENPYIITEDETRRRIKQALNAYWLMLGGAIGASLSHSLPHASCEELILSISEKNPIPIPVSPIYDNHDKKYLGLLNKVTDDENVHVLFYSADEKKRADIENMRETHLHVDIQVYDKIGSLFDEAAKIYGV